MLTDRENENAVTRMRRYRFNHSGFQWWFSLIGLDVPPLRPSTACTDSLIFAGDSSGAMADLDRDRGRLFRVLIVAARLSRAKKDSIRELGIRTPALEENHCWWELVEHVVRNMYVASQSRMRACDEAYCI